MLSILIVLFMNFVFADAHLKSIPVESKVRLCCGFGDKKLVSLTGLSKNLGFEDLEKSKHTFIYDQKITTKEANGIIYTCSGGFIDIAHVRDLADITYHIYKLLESNEELIQLKKNPTQRKVIIKTQTSSLAKIEKAYLAQSIAYDISVWHEIYTLPGFLSTFFEENSAFSVEDNYSNYLGTVIAREAIISGQPYKKIINKMIIKHIKDLIPMSTKQKTAYVYKLIKKKWWKSGLTYKSVMARHTKSYDIITPVTVPEVKECTGHPVIAMNALTSFSDIYDFKIDLNSKMRDYFIKHNINIDLSRENLNQYDFHEIIKYAKKRFLDDFNPHHIY